MGSLFNRLAEDPDFLDGRSSGSINMEPAQGGDSQSGDRGSRGGLTTKIAALVDGLGNLVRFVLLPGQRHDIKSVDDLMAGVSCGAFIGDKAFDAEALRQRLAEDNIEAVIPRRKGSKAASDYDREKYKWRDRSFRFTN